MELKGKSYLITGASSGIGRSVSNLLSSLGARCVLVARDKERLEIVRNELVNSDQHVVIAFDLKDIDHYSELFGAIKESAIVLDGMVHCAGITKVTPLRTFSREQALELFDIHYFAFMELVKQYAKKGIANGGSIVGISAINSHVPQKCMTAYASAKAAVEAACRTLAIELSEKNIRINSIVVGGISTGMGSEIHEAASAVKSDYVNPVSRQLLGVGSAGQIAPVVAFLLSDDASFITGRELYADGGLL